MLSPFFKVSTLRNWPAGHPAFFCRLVFVLCFGCFLFCLLLWFVFLCTGPTSGQLLKPTFEDGKLALFWRDGARQLKTDLKGFPKWLGEFGLQRPWWMTAMWLELQQESWLGGVQATSYFFSPGTTWRFESSLESANVQILVIVLFTQRRYCWYYNPLVLQWSQFWQGSTGCRDMLWGSRGAPFGEGTLSPLRRYLKPLPKGGRGGRGGVNEEPKPP